MTVEANPQTRSFAVAEATDSARKLLTCVDARISAYFPKLDGHIRPEWRAVWRNPVNGAEALYNASHAFAVDGMDADEGTNLIDELIAWVTQQPYTYSHQWQVGDVLIWDHRAVLHRGTGWNYKEPRVLSSICVSATATDGVDAMRLIV